MIILSSGERKMLLVAAKSFKAADENFIEHHNEEESTDIYGPINKEMIRKWNALIKKLR